MQLSGVNLVEKDLVEQAGLDSEDFEQDFGFFRYKGRIVVVSHMYDEHLVVSIKGKEDDCLKNLMDAFSKVVGYQPFCKYVILPEEGSDNPLLPTYEWDKVDSESRYKELQEKSTIENLIKL